MTGAHGTRNELEAIGELLFKEPQAAGRFALDVQKWQRGEQRGGQQGDRWIAVVRGHGDRRKTGDEKHRGTMSQAGRPPLQPRGFQFLLERFFEVEPFE